MTLFSSLRARPSPLASSDDKDHDSDGGGGADEETATHPQRTPLLSEASPGSTTIDAFAVRIKLNDGRSTTDFPLDGISPSSTVRTLKERILRRHFDALHASNATNGTNSNHANPRNRYLRLIVRGRMMAPDLSPLSTFALVPDDVIHAVLAKEGARGGQQARMLRRMNGGTPGGGTGTGVGTGGGGTRASSVAERSLWRRVGIDANGVVVSSANADSDDEESDDSEVEDAHGELDVEGGRRAGTAGEGGRRRRRERRGFDRLRSTGMTRAEVSAIRHAFARPVDRYIERRRAMLRASRRLREGLGSLATGRATGGGEDASSSGGARPRSDTGGSTNSLLDEDESNNAAGGGSNGDTSNNSNEGEDGGAGSAGNNDASTPAEGEEILTDRLRMEDEWMSTQGPYSEFRMNLNTSNPLLLAAITGGGGASPAALPPDMGPAGLLFRRNAGAGFVGGLDPLADDDDEGGFGPGGAFLRHRTNPNAFPLGPYPYMGPVPPAGTDKDFVWGFILGFFVGFIMLFWVWMPTVPHKQKVGIISGISFQLGLNLLRKGHGGPSVSI